MLRKKLFNSSQELFKHRATEIVRVEALSDAVFAFSVSLLVASLEVPQTFEELRSIIFGALPFFATIAIVFLLWYQQYIFFRHYGLNDTRIIVLNLVYLAVILFYIYPLKFLFSLLIGSWTGIDLFPKATEAGKLVLSVEEFPQLIMLFGTGYFVIWFLLYLMHRHVLKFGARLALSHYELCYTRKEKRGALMNALIGISSVLLAWIEMERAAGICYLLIPLVLFINHKWFLNELKNKNAK